MNDGVAASSHSAFELRDDSACSVESRQEVKIMRHGTYRNMSTREGYPLIADRRPKKGTR
jgi:hypothetical protein